MMLWDRDVDSSSVRLRQTNTEHIIAEKTKCFFASNYWFQLCILASLWDDVMPRICRGTGFRFVWNRDEKFNLTQISESSFSREKEKNYENLTLIYLALLKIIQIISTKYDKYPKWNSSCGRMTDRMRIFPIFWIQTGIHRPVKWVYRISNSIIPMRLE